MTESARNKVVRDELGHAPCDSLGFRHRRTYWHFEVNGDQIAPHFRDEAEWNAPRNVACREDEHRDARCNGEVSPAQGFPHNRNVDVLHEAL